MKDIFWPIRKRLMKSNIVTKNAKEKAMSGKTPKFALSKDEVHDKWKNYEERNPGRMVNEYSINESKSDYLLQQINHYD